MAWVMARFDSGGSAGVMVIQDEGPFAPGEQLQGHIAFVGIQSQQAVPLISATSMSSELPKLIWGGFVFYHLS